MDIYYWSAPRTRVHTKAGVSTSKKDALETLRVILEDTTDPVYRGHLYKIGITGKPQLRSYGHNWVIVDEDDLGPDTKWVVMQQGLWDRMHVILQVPGAAAVRQAERDFIAFALKTYGGVLKEGHRPGQNVFSFNDNPGGEGPLPKSGPYFLYVLQSRA